MKTFILSMVVCLSMLIVTTWLVVTPVYAGGATAECGPGGTAITCSGTQCGSSDATPSGGGYCTCTRSDGTIDHKTCTYSDKPAPVEPPQN